MSLWETVQPSRLDHGLPPFEVANRKSRLEEIVKKHEPKPEKHQEELDILVTRMWQKRSLYRMRGFFDPLRRGKHPIEQTLDEEETVTQMAAKAKERAKDLRIFEQTLHQFRTRGYTYAEETLFKMAYNQLFTLPDEQFPQDELISYVALMLQPELTIAVLGELKKMEPHEVLFREQLEVENVADYQRKFAIAKRLCELLPTFKRLFDQGPWVGYHEVVVSYVNDVVSHYQPLPTITNFAHLPNKHHFSRYHQIKEALTDLHPSINAEDYGQMIPGFVFFLQGHSDDVINSLGDETDHNAAVWQFWLPRFMSGFKPEAIWFDKPKPHLEHTYATPFASTNQALGWRPILIPDHNGACSQAELYLEA
jgi:hypothetical protein